MSKTAEKDISRVGRGWGFDGLTAILMKILDFRIWRFVVWCRVNQSCTTTKMEASHFSEKLPVYHDAWHHDPED